MRRAAWLAAGLWLAVACSGRPPTIIQVQGTVRSFGTRVPVAAAQVTIEWPITLGGGQSVLRTNTSGQFAVGRPVRRRKPVCTGLALTVEAPGYASAYARHEADCGTNVLTFNFVLLPQPG